jgi:hypothetical protein
VADRVEQSGKAGGGPSGATVLRESASEPSVAGPSLSCAGSYRQIADRLAHNHRQTTIERRGTGLTVAAVHGARPLLTPVLGRLRWRAGNARSHHDAGGGIRAAVNQFSAGFGTVVGHQASAPARRDGENDPDSRWHEPSLATSRAGANTSQLQIRTVPTALVTYELSEFARPRQPPYFAKRSTSAGMLKGTFAEFMLFPYRLPRPCSRADRLQNLSKNWVDSGGLSGTREDSRSTRNPKEVRTLTTKDEQHHHVRKCRSLGFDSLPVHRRKRATVVCQPCTPSSSWTPYRIERLPSRAHRSKQKGGGFTQRQSSSPTFLQKLSRLRDD